MSAADLNPSAPPEPGPPLGLPHGLPTSGKGSGPLGQGQDLAQPPWVLGLLLAAAVLLVYSNSFRGPFLYDDYGDVLDNPSIRHLWPLKDVFYIQGRGFLTRPVANLTFALNHATGGLNPYHFHLTNLGIHLCAALAFLGALRRALLLPSLRERFSGSGSTLALVAAALWALHPLLTESVAYITQRYESLMGLFVLLTFYCAIRMAQSLRPRVWAALGSLACLLALGSKEVAVSLPALVLLFDRTFMAGSFREAWRVRRGLYLGFLVAWAGFAYLQLHAMPRTFAGFGLTTPWWRYALTQPGVVLHYLRLAVWPHPLNFDYFWPVAKTWGQMGPSLAIIGLLVGWTALGLFRGSRLAFLAAFFFLILAPTSSVMPILDLAVEHRMYLPLVPVVVGFVFAGHHLVAEGRLKRFAGAPWVRLAAILLIAGTLSAFGTLTYLRNEDYQNSLDLWRDTVTKSPNNPRARHNYAYNLAEEGYNAEAISQFTRSIELAPGVALFHDNFGVFLGKIGRFPEALEHLRAAVRLEPDNFRHIANLGVVHRQKGSLDNAIVCFETAIQVDPRASAPYSGLASAMLAKKEPRRAQELIGKAIALEPNKSGPRYLLGLVQLELGDLPAARAAFQIAVRLDGSPEKMISDIGQAFHECGLDAEGVLNLREALNVRPGHARSQYRLAWILATSPDDSLRNGEEAFALASGLLRSQPTPSPDLLDLIGVAQAQLGRFPEARASLQAALLQARERNEASVPELEQRLVGFENNQAYRHAHKQPAPPPDRDKRPAS